MLLGRSVLIVCIFFLPAFGFANDFERGQKAFRARDYDAAIAAFTASLAENDKHLPSLMLRGRSLIEKGDLEKAIADFTAVLAIAPRNAQALAHRGRAYSFATQHDKALTDLEQAVKLAPRSPRVFTNRGAALFRKAESSAQTFVKDGRVYVQIDQKLIDRAVEDFNEALKLNPKFVDALGERAKARQRKGELDKAIADLDEAIRIQPRGDFHELRGMVFRQKGEKDRAIADYGEAIKLDPKRIWPYLTLARLHFEKEDFDSVITDTTQALEIDARQTEALILRGDAHFRKKRFARADQDYREAVTVAPNDVWANAALAWHLAVCPVTRLRNGKEAVAAAQKACETTRYGNGWFVTCLAAAHAEAGDFTEAVKWQKKAIELKNGLPEEAEKNRQRLKLFETGKPYRENN